jgi:hypothetical protein
MEESEDLPVGGKSVPDQVRSKNESYSDIEPDYFGRRKIGGVVLVPADIKASRRPSSRKARTSVLSEETDSWDRDGCLHRRQASGMSSADFSSQEWTDGGRRVSVTRSRDFQDFLARQQRSVDHHNAVQEKSSRPPSSRAATSSSSSGFSESAVLMKGIATVHRRSTDTSAPPRQRDPSPVASRDMKSFTSRQFETSTRTKRIGDRMGMDFESAKESQPLKLPHRTEKLWKLLSGLRTPQNEF